MNKKVYFFQRNSFTLIELLVVIAVLAVLATVVIIALNPFEFAKQARDARRLSELQTINTSLGVYQTGGGIYLGSSTAVYVSIPDSSATCANLGLPTLPSGWGYQCASSSTYRNINGTGWISVDFTSGSYGPGLEKLPIDPINTTSSGNYYTYVPGGSWEMTTMLESDKYADKAINDGDSYPGVYSLRTSAAPLTPGTRDKGMVGYWSFEEGSGTTAYDNSGYGNNGIMESFMTPKNLHTSSGCKVGLSCASFNGADDNIDCGNRASLNITTAFTIIVWVKTATLGESIDTVISKYDGSNGYFLRRSSTNINLQIYNSGSRNANFNADFSQQDVWVQFVLTLDRDTTAKFYKNGGLAGSVSGVTIGQSTYQVAIGSDYGISSEYFTGSVDDVRIYNRALSAAEVAAIYNATK